MHASDSYIIISILRFSLRTTSPYDLLPDGTPVERKQASSAQADQIEPL